MGLNWRLLLTALLLLAGDVPGPVTCPCSVCWRPVKCNQRALQCDCCQLWVHCTCSGVSNQEYCYFQELEVFSWCCPRCLVEQLPFHDCSVMSMSDSDFSCAGSDLSLCYPLKAGTFHIAHLNCHSYLIKMTF